MSREIVYAITTDGCGRLYVELPDGEVLADRKLPDHEQSLVEYQEFMIALIDDALEREDRRV